MIIENDALCLQIADKPFGSSPAYTVANAARASFWRDWSISFRSQASAWVTMVSKSSYCGSQPRTERIFSPVATISAGSPARRGAVSTLKFTPDTLRTVSITSETDEPWP